MIKHYLAVLLPQIVLGKVAPLLIKGYNIISAIKMLCAPIFYHRYLLAKLSMPQNVIYAFLCVIDVINMHLPWFANANE